MSKIFISVCFFITSFTFAKEEIEVHLKTKKKLSPIYISKVFLKKSTFSKEYLTKVRDVLKFDVNNTGYTCVALEEEFLDNMLISKNFGFEFLKKQPFKFILKLEAVEDKIKIVVCNPLKGELIDFCSLTLKGDLKEDRRKIHKFSNDFLFEFFKKRGIAKTRILYTLRKKNENGKITSEVWICDYDGENKKRLTFENSYAVHPLFIPTNEKKEIPEFLYVSYKRGIPKIYISIDGKSFDFIPLRGNQLLPSISKDFSYISFISDVAGRADLFLQKIYNKKPIGKPFQVFAYPRAVQASSSFSPNAEKLAFVSSKGGSPRIYLLKIPKNVKKRKRPYAELVTKKNRRNVTPAWSNGGKKLVYSAKTNGIRQIWVYDFFSGKEKQLTHGPKNKENPKWAVNDLHIVYNTEDKGVSEMYIINLNNPKPVKISSGFGQKRFPTWENKGQL
jgi:TolB protein